MVLVHGLWGNSNDWIDFSPSVPDESQLWSQLEITPGDQVFWADYSTPVAVGSTTPPFSNLTQVSGSALGFEYNAPIVLNQILKWISTYASNLNVAASQADVIAHSMGGNVARTMAVPNEPWTFLTNGTYGIGPIEKLITIGTPHLGSPLATQLLPTGSSDPNSCVREVLGHGGDVALQVANVGNARVNGGVNDLVGDGQDTSGLSELLQSLRAAQSTQPFPMAYLSGTESAGNLAGLSSCDVSGCTAAAINSICGTLFHDPLGNSFTSDKWPFVFGANTNGQANPSDGVALPLGGTSA